MTYLERSVDQKKIIWFAEKNHYMLVEMPAFHVISQLSEGIALKKIAAWCSKFYKIPKSEANRFVGEVEQLLLQQPERIVKSIGTNDPWDSRSILPDLALKKHYLLPGCTFTVEYDTPQTEFLVHPKFAHLESVTSQQGDHLFQVFQQNEMFVLRVNGKTIGQWPEEESNYFTGKFTMELINLIYNRNEHDWMGVFHASAIRLGNQCALFLGDSGNGKSTLAALLMASGFNLVADDFVPVDAISGEVFCLPAAVSIKKNAIGSLVDAYPQLATAEEYYYSEMDKTVRYLPPDQNVENHLVSYPCKALVFVKYLPESGLVMEKMSQVIAFQNLIPDSWVSDRSENVNRFLDWFLQIPCYRLTYSDNGAMVRTIENLFKDEG